MTARPVLVADVTEAWTALTKEQRLAIARIGEALYLAVDALTAESPFAFSLED